MGEVQEVAPDAKEALATGIRIANKIADCGPLGIETPFASAHLAIGRGEEEALSRLEARFGALFHTQDFLEGRKAERLSTRENKRESRNMRPTGLNKLPTLRSRGLCQLSKCLPAKSCPMKPARSFHCFHLFDFCLDYRQSAVLVEL
jgi:hypothetical protein